MGRYRTALDSIAGRDITPENCYAVAHEMRGTARRALLPAVGPELDKALDDFVADKPKDIMR